MTSPTLKSGTCPKCNSTEIYTTKDMAKRGERMTIAVSGWKKFFLDTYVCTSCGHFEEHIPEKELQDIELIEKIKETWNKVKK